MRAVVLAVIYLVLLAGCSAGRGPENGATGETTGPESGERGVSVEKISEGQRGSGGPRVVVAGSAGELERATGVEAPDRGAGIYVCALAGERPTGGYRVGVSSGEGGSVRVTLREPGQGDIVTQAITTPYAVAVVRGEGTTAESLRFVNAGGGELGWPVRRA